MKSKLFGSITCKDMNRNFSSMVSYSRVIQGWVVYFKFLCLCVCACVRVRVWARARARFVRNMERVSRQIWIFIYRCCTSE